ncbi:DUF3788 family protein [Flavobacterium silvisoli]|uniref:DUF3788 family protein n=1 Tax=Flavobacterium silvisoli TaxID=2529433 RepID=UPI001386D5A4|nr:DUF3788 family protein [Flavobacterium silvisoli]
MKSIFAHKDQIPNQNQLKDALAGTYEYWQTFVAHTQKLSPKATQTWHYSGDLYGWSFRIKDNKRILIYLLPRDQFFKIGMVFGPNATHQIMTSTISETIKKELQAAKAHAEGRGIRIAITEPTFIQDVLTLIDIKINSGHK